MPSPIQSLTFATMAAVLAAPPVWVQSRGEAARRPAPEEQTGLKVGTKAPKFPLEDPSGKERSLDVFLVEGKVALVLEAPQGAHPESDEARRLDFEVKAPPTARGEVRLAAYALYNTCEGAGGRCLFLRQDLTIPLDVAP
jgi:hypothetical protein